MITETLQSYTDLFVQRIPRYAVKPPGGTWHTRHRALHDEEIKKHLACQQAVACLSRWYPEYAVLDTDDVTRTAADRIRAGFLLDDSNSMLLSSESPDSYHVYFRPDYNGKPPTIDLLQAVLKPYAKARGIEIYPQRNRAFRLPFGKGQNCLDFKEQYLKSWQEKLYWLQKKDDFDLSSVKGHQTFFDFKPTEHLPAIDLGAAGDIKGLLANGLQAPSTRDSAQFEIIKHLWRQNVTQDDAWRFLWVWIGKKHNGFSRDYLRNPKMVRDHIRHQVFSYYDRMRNFFVLPDHAHISHKGYICRPDLLEIVKVCAGNLPRMKFIFELVKYMNPRRFRESVPVHRDKLVEWSSWRTYKNHLEYLEGKGILKRGSGYLVGEKSKGIKLDWPYQTEQEAVLFEGRAVENLEKAVPMLFKPEDFRGLLEGYVKRTTALMTVKTLFSCQKWGHI